MALSIEDEIVRFDGLLERLKKAQTVEMISERAFVVFPKNYKKTPSIQKDIDLTLTGLVHGVEVAGLSVMCNFISKLLDKEFEPLISIGIGIGNVEAALAKKRFLDRDLNRSFASRDATSLEGRRATELEKLLLRSKYYVDFHQVKMPSKSQFWIFPYKKECFKFARLIGPDVPLITHWGKSFSAEGQCSDEFVNKNGGVGVTIELGQNGFDSVQMENGLKTALRAVEVATALIHKTTYKPQAVELAPIYTWGAILPYPATGKPVLNPGWSNFVEVSAGQVLGQFEGEAIVSPRDGWLLFPKYPDQPASGDYGTTPPAAELVRILKKIDESELPTDL